MNQDVKVSKWEKVENFTQLVQRTLKLREIKKLFIDSFDQYKIHKCLVNVQCQILRTIKETQDEKELIIMDYSQNYATISQNESAFFARWQISIFTAIVYVAQNDPLTYIIANDDIAHQKEQVWYYQRGILEDVKKEKLIEKVRFFTDGCAAQFKNKYTLSNLLYAKEDFQVEIEWHFMPTSHGKSPADGLGGSIKRGVYNRVLSGGFEVYTASDFVACAKTLTGNTRIMNISREETSKFDIMLKNRWEKVKTIPGTRSFLFFAPVDGSRQCWARS